MSSKTDKECEFVAQVLCASAVCNLMYAMVCLMLNISEAVSLVGEHCFIFGG